MKKKQSFWWTLVYGLVLACFTAFVVLDTFVIPKRGTAVSETSRPAAATSATKADSTGKTSADSSKSADEGFTGKATDTSYKDDNIKIEITETRYEDTDVYLADVTVSSVDYLRTALADNTYGRNIKQTTSEMAEAHDTLLAVNGDFYGFRSYGYVVRNGTLYRDTAGRGDALVIGRDGDFSIVREKNTSAQTLMDQGAWQVLSFGPALVEDSTMSVTYDDEVGQSMMSNPRTAIGMIEPLHYLLVVSDGRTSRNAGLSLYQLAKLMQDNGCTTAYNLDGGGSTTMWFRGEVINNPTDGHSMEEREVSDIVYIGA